LEGYYAKGKVQGGLGTCPLSKTKREENELDGRGGVGANGIRGGGRGLGKSGWGKKKKKGRENSLLL